MKKRIRIQGISIFLTLIISVVFFKYIIPIREYNFANRILDFMGIGMVILGFLFRLSARGYKKEKSQESRKLTTGGPYTLMRNPMYFGSLLIGIGIISTLFNWWILLPFIIIYLAILVPQIHKEELTLENQFGQEYIKYCKNTPGYFPKTINLFKLNFREYLPLRWAWVTRESISWFLVFIGVIIIKVWEVSRMYG
ncbi:MAG: isoprenylcysteine carboxylmethyltransferase family protein [Candidatus Omnitrophota bacterium]